VDGNIIYISNTITIDSFTGSVGQVFYATIVDGLMINAQGGLSVRPPHNIWLNAGDTIIFHFTETDVIRILGHWRQNGQQWFQLADVAAFQLLAGVDALQIGSWYYIEDGYVAGGGQEWDIKLMANTTSTFDLRVYLSRDGGWYPAIAIDNSIGQGTIQFTGFIDNIDAVPYDNYIGLANVGQYQAMSSMAISDPQRLIQSRGFVAGDSQPQTKNLLNLGNANQTYFGRMLYSQNVVDTIFFSHDGTILQWGNNFDTENGLDATKLLEINISFGNEPQIQQWNATYHIVNDTCILNFSAQIIGKFNQGASGNEFYLYIPLPFESNMYLGGSGSVRFIDLLNNHEDNAAFVLPYDVLDNFNVLFSSKWKNSINNETNIQIVGNYTYRI
jgi:hypothetical protein